MKDQISKLPSSLGGTDSEGTKFYNTIGLLGNGLEIAKKQNHSQEAKLLEFLERKPIGVFTKSEICKNLINEGKLSTRTPENSISRALSNLLEKGLVIKLNEFRQGNLGNPNHLWKAISKPIETCIQTKLFEK